MSSKSFLQQAVNYAEGRCDYEKSENEAAVGYEEWVALEQRKGLETVTESQCSAEWLTFWRKVL